MNIEFFNTGARYKNKYVISLVINNKLNKQQIENIVNGMSRELRQYDNDGLIDVSVRSDKWYFKGQTTFSNRYIIPEDYDGVPDVSDEYDKTAIYISALPKSKGGDGKTNDCLYNCLYQVLKEKLTKIFKYPSDLKKFLSLSASEKVDIQHIEQIENKLNISINVRGDFTYSTKLSSNKVINLLLINEHYTINTISKNIFKLKQKVSLYKDRDIMMYDKSTFFCI